MTVEPIDHLELLAIYCEQKGWRLRLTVRGMEPARAVTFGGQAFRLPTLRLDTLEVRSRDREELLARARVNDPGELDERAEVLLLALAASGLIHYEAA